MGNDIEYVNKFREDCHLNNIKSSYLWTWEVFQFTWVFLNFFQFCFILSKHGTKWNFINKKQIFICKPYPKRILKKILFLPPWGFWFYFKSLALFSFLPECPWMVRHWASGRLSSYSSVYPFALPFACFIFSLFFFCLETIIALIFPLQSIHDLFHKVQSYVLRFLIDIFMSFTAFNSLKSHLPSLLFNMLYLHTQTLRPTFY